VNPRSPTAAASRWWPILALGVLGTLWPTGRAAADPPRAESAAKKAPTEALPSGVITPEMWRQAATGPLQPGEIDRLISQGQAKGKVTPAARTSDEQFLRRVWLDLTGNLPMPADIDEFSKDRDPARRAKMIDRLLASDAYARHWARYWREVVASRVTDQIARVNAPQFERWLLEQLKANKGWGEVAKTLLTATGPLRFDGKESSGPAFFLGSRRGADAVTERAAETSRVFLGIQIQCAQCHDHPSDVWKRQQFHEFAAYFARLRERPIFEDSNGKKRFVGFQLVSFGFGEYQMPGKDDPKKKTVTMPRFLDGKAPGARLSDTQRRTALADAIISKDNPWFAAAYVNRMWGELMGQSFYQPVDDMGPQKEAVFPTVLARLSGSFRGSDYDTKALLRAILNSEAYQRQIRLGESPEEHLMFAAVYPTRLRADALYQSLTGALGQMNPVGPGGLGRRPPGPFGRFLGFEFQFKQEFNFDPSSRPEEVEGSVPQALMMMNSPQINQKIRATGTNLLARILSSYSDNDEALRVVYLRALARRPTDRELERCREHIRTAGSRDEGFEDILWALLNSAEFQTKR
jgi:hypothetical protein